MSRRSIGPRLAVVAALLAAGLVASGCSDDDDSLELVGPEWLLLTARVGGTAVYPGPFAGPTTVRFRSDLYEGFDGCGAFGGNARYTAFGVVVEPSDQWRAPATCTMDGYYPSHFEAPFGADVRGDELTVTSGDDVYVYRRR